MRLVLRSTERDDVGVDDDDDGCGDDGDDDEIDR